MKTKQDTTFVQESSSVDEAESRFQVKLANFTGPFDLLLHLVSKHQLDVTEVALAEVTDEFLSYMTNFPELSQVSEFLVVAATLLDIKAARLLPQTETDSEEDLEFLETRDLLFARLLQYRAFKETSRYLSSQWEHNQTMTARSVPLEPQFAALLPQLVFTIDPEELARRAAEALYYQTKTVAVAHLHDPLVPVREQVNILMRKLRGSGTVTFRDLVADAGSKAVIVSRFLGVLELFRADAIVFEQLEPLGELTVRWTKMEINDIDMVDDYEQGELS